MNFRVASLCFTDTPGFGFHHQISLVALSYLVAAVGSYTALEMIERWRNARPGRALSWRLASAVMLGGTAWSMHFIAMLALQIALPVTYAPGTTALSMLIIIAAAGCGLHIVRRHATALRISCAGITLGLGVAAMHYVGMAGLRFPGTLAYTPVLWSLSVLFGIFAGTVALWLALMPQKPWQRAAAALVMGATISGMHYVGMASTVFQADPLAQLADGVPGDAIAIAVTLTTLALMLCVIVTVVADRRLMATEMRNAEILRQSNAELARANAELRHGRQQFDAALSNMSHGLTVVSPDLKLIVCSSRFNDLYGLSADQTRPGTPLSDMLDLLIDTGTFPDMTREDYLARRQVMARAAQPYEVTIDLQDGRTVSLKYRPLPDGGWVTTHEDITERRRAEAEIVFMARYDVLTRLPNRVTFHERLEQAVDMAARGHTCAIHCVDVDNFKDINDTLGHVGGDTALKAVADRLRACVREGDIVARLGGDEFAIIQQTISQPADGEILANRIMMAFQEPFDFDGHQIVIGLSMGATLLPQDGRTAEKLLKNADIALYLAKTEGRGRVRFFAPEMDARIQARRLLEIDLHRAIEHNEFELYYQPSIDLTTGRINAFEALLRWHHPTRGLVSPAEFVPVAEETGMIVTIGEWALRSACMDARNWPAGISVAVNLSPVQFKNRTPVAAVQEALDASGLRPDRLVLEITESVLLEDAPSTLAALHQLRDFGIAVSLDDFGTGYSSLSYLHRFPFDKLKIDRSFVRDMTSNKDSMSIIRAVTGLGHSLQMTIIAEGVETLEQLNMLRDEGCTEVQGYYFSRPRPVRDLPVLIAQIHKINDRPALPPRLDADRGAMARTG